MAPSEVSVAAGVLARGLRDNPTSIAAFGPDANLRSRRLQRLFASRLDDDVYVVCARDANGIAGVATFPPAAAQ
jgi:hypothetical protein